MNSRQRFRQTMACGQPDRVPLFEEGLRDEVLAAWRSQGLSDEIDLSQRFHYDPREELDPDVDPRPAPDRWPTTLDDLPSLRQSLDPHDPQRLPSDWHVRLTAWREREHTLMLRVHHGFFQSLGVGGWDRFIEVIRLLVDDPKFVHAALEIQGEFAARLTERVLRQVEVDAAIFSEPIGGNHGPLISPRMYETFVLRSYRPLLEVLKRHQVQTIILRSYANPRVLIPAILKAGFDCLWACECGPEAVDYRQLRAEFGRDLKLIGGIDADVLRQSKEDIHREIEEKVWPLLAEGGFIPLADGRVREDVLFENYVYYRQLLEETVKRLIYPR